MNSPFNPIYSFFKPHISSQKTEEIDIDINKKNIFQNNVLYFQKYKVLEEKVDYLQKINGFLAAQVLQNFGARKATHVTDIKKQSGPIRKKSMKFEDDRCLNKTYQLFNIFKGLLHNSNKELSKIADTYFPEDFDFESSLYNKNHQIIINLVLKTSINSIVCMQDILATKPHLNTLTKPTKPANLQKPNIDNTSMFLANALQESLSGKSMQGRIR